MNNDFKPDPPLTPEQRSKVTALAPQLVQVIDTELLANVVSDWRKVARVTGAAMSNLQGHGLDLPDLYYAERVRELVRSGVIEAQGDLNAMRYSEVRKCAAP